MPGEHAGEVAGGGARCVVRGQGRQPVGLAQCGDAVAGRVEGFLVRTVGGDALPGQPVRVGLRAVSGVQLVPGGQAAGAEEVVVAEDFPYAEVGEDGGGDAAVQRLQGGGGADGDQQVGAVEDLAHVPVHQAAVGGQSAGGLGGELLVREFLDVRGVLAGLAAQLDQHLAFGVLAGVFHGAAQQIRAVGAAVRDGGLGGEHHGVGVVFAGVALPAEEGEGAFDDAGVVGADAAVDRAEPVRVVTGVGEDDVRAVPQQQSVGEFFVDDADIAGDDDGAAVRSLPGAGEPVQHRLHRTAYTGEHHDVVSTTVGGTVDLPYAAFHFVQEVDAADFAQRVRTGADLVELADRGRGAAAQQKTVELDVRLDSVRCQSAPFPPGVRVGEYGDARRGSGT